MCPSLRRILRWRTNDCDALVKSIVRIPYYQVTLVISYITLQGCRVQTKRLEITVER